MLMVKTKGGTTGISKPYKGQIFQMPWFWINGHKLKTTECEHQYGARNLCPGYAQCKFYVYVSTDVTADAASCWTLVAFILTLEKSEPKM